MTGVAADATAAAGRASADNGTPAAPAASLRKARLAGVILLGQTLASSLLPSVGLGVALAPMARALGGSSTELLLAYGFLMWFGALALWPLGLLTDRFGARPVIILGTLGVGLVTLLLPQVRTVWQAHLLFAALGVCGASAASYTKVMAALFSGNRGKAMAVLGIQGALAGAGLPAATAWLAARLGWRGMFDVFAVSILACTPALVLWLDEPGARRPKPAESRSAAQASRPRAAAMAYDGLPFGAILRERVLWQLLIGLLAAVTVANGMLWNIPGWLLERGFTAREIGRADTLAALATAPGLLIAGALLDRAPTARIAAVFQLLTMASAAMLMTAAPGPQGAILLTASRTLFMLAFASSLPVAAYLMARFFGLRAFAQAFGLMAMILTIGMGFAPALLGRLHEATHSYRPGFEALMASAALAAAAFLALPAYRFPAAAGRRTTLRASGPARSEPRGAAAIPAE